MAKFNPTKIKAFQDFLELQNSLKNAQKSYEDVKRMEELTDAIMCMGIETGAAAQQYYIRSRNRKRLFIGLALAGGAYLYSKAKTKKVDDDVPSSRENGYIDYSRRPKKRSNRTSKEVKYYEK